MMHLTEVFKEFIRKRLESAPEERRGAEETLKVFHGVIDDDEIERLYHVIWNPQVKLRRTGKGRFPDPGAFFVRLTQTVLRSSKLHFFFHFHFKFFVVM